MYLMCQNFAQKVEWVNKLEEVIQILFLLNVYNFQSLLFESGSELDPV